MTRPPSHFVRQLDASTVSRGSQQEILAELHRAIASGRALPGSPILIDEVAELFGVSPVPIREALKTLSAEGLVSHEGRRGYRVAQLTPAEYEELNLVFRALDLTVLPVAMEKATPDDVERVAAALAAEEDALYRNDIPGYLAASRAFHDEILRPSGLRQIIALYDQTWDRIATGRPLQHAASEQRTTMVAEHRDLLEAFRSRDLDALVAAIDVHHRVLHSMTSSIASADAASYLFRDEPLP